MSSSDRWGALASELGINPVPPMPSEPKSATPPPLRPPPKPAAPKPQRPSTDWSRLAGDLGLDPTVVAAAARPPAPPKMASPPPAAAAQTARTAPPVPPTFASSAPPARLQRTEPTERPERIDRPERIERPDRPRPPQRREPAAELDAKTPDAGFEPFDDRGDEIPSAEDASRAGHGEDEDRPRRRRRRRGGRGRSRQREQRSLESPRSAAGDQSSETLDLSDKPWHAEPFQSHGDNEPLTDQSDEPFGDDLDRPPALRADEEGEPRRGRRRGRRERSEGDARRPRAESTRDQEAADDYSEEARHPSDNLAQLPGDDEHGDDEDADDVGHELDKSHRTVPSWNEAIGLIVSVNLEARTRSPESRPAHRGRGRGRQDGGR